MQICNEHGDDIAYEGIYCPACTQVDDLEDETDSLEEEISSLKDIISELETELANRPE